MADDAKVASVNNSQRPEANCRLCRASCNPTSAAAPANAMVITATARTSRLAKVEKDANAVPAAIPHQ
jgi:hypothetical protein